MHHKSVSTNYDWLPHNVDSSIPTPRQYQGMPLQPLGNRQQFYEDLMEGCFEEYGEQGRRCYQNEKDRISMSLRQPVGVYNYTELGYTKIKAPEAVFQLIQEFWEANKESQRIEKWPAGNTYVNHWEVPTMFASIEDASLEGGGYVLKQKIWNAARDTISQWTGQQLAECSLYGIRIYQEGAVLATHVDRLPLVASAIINVDQDTDEPWPLEVIGHDGIAKNITMVPGDLVLYESHSVLHGRPFPLKGRFMANIFVHFEPIGPVGSQVALEADLPNYIVRGSAEEINWKRRNPDGYQLHDASSALPSGATPLHQAAQKGDVDSVKRLLHKKVHLVNSRDRNGWMPLHEAVREGSTENVQLLLDHGADINARTQVHEAGASGGTALWWALEYHEKDSKVVQLLVANGAKKIKPHGSEEEQV